MSDFKFLELKRFLFLSVVSFFIFLISLKIHIISSLSLSPKDMTLKEIHFQEMRAPKMKEVSSRKKGYAVNDSWNLLFLACIRLQINNG